MSSEAKYYEYNPEKRNIFIEMYGRRNNHVIEFIGSLFMLFASHASSIIEVFLRKRFGERYITLAQSISLFFIILISYTYIENLFRVKQGGIFLFIFACAYLAMSIRHRLEIKKYGTAYDFKRFSLSNGEVANFWWKILGKKVLGVKITSYLVSVLLEPAIPILLGIIFMFLDFTKPVGIILIFCGIVFSVRNFLIAQKGRDWVLDNIDKKISNEMQYDIFIGRKPQKDTKGIYMPIELPEDLETREALYNAVKMASTETEDIWLNDNLDNPKEKRRERDGLSDEDGSEGGGGLSSDKGGSGSSGGLTDSSGVGNGLSNDSGGAGIG